MFFLLRCFARVRRTQPIGLPYVTLQAKMLIKKGKVRHADLAGNSEKMKKNLVVWCIKGVVLPSYTGIIINHYKDPRIPVKQAV